MADANDEPNLVEPSDDERARLPETTQAYIEALEARLDHNHAGRRVTR
jgi:hypothetical protein